MAWWNDPTLWDWITTAAKTAVGAFGGTALVQGIFVIYRDRRQSKLHAAYMAMRLAVTLESYTAACSDYITENNSLEPNPRDEYPDWNTTLPVLAPYPDDAEGWRAIDNKLAGRCLSLPLKIQANQVSIRWTIEFCIEHLEYLLHEQAAERGLEAWKLAMALRRRHGIESADETLDCSHQLEEELTKAIAVRAKRQNDPGLRAMADQIEESQRGSPRAAVKA